MDDKDVVLALGQVQGSLSANVAAINNKIDQTMNSINETVGMVGTAVKELKDMHAKLVNRVINLEKERAVASKAGAIYGTTAGIITTAIINLSIRMLT